MPSSGQLDERAERVVALEPDRGTRVVSSECVGLKERVGPYESDVARERLLEHNDRNGPREQPDGDRCGSDGNRGNNADSWSHRTKMPRSVVGRQR